MPSRLFRLLFPVALAAAIAPLARAQEYELRDGRRIPASNVKIVPDGFTATVANGPNSYETIVFQVKDILRVSLPEPRALVEARVHTASGKTEDAIAAAQKTAKEFEIIKNIPGSWWGRAMLTQMDALATAGKASETTTLVSESVRRKLPEADGAALEEFVNIVAPANADPEERIKTLKKNSDVASDSWLAARAWIEAGTLLMSRGRVEEAVKAWLRVPTFFASETDLSFRGTVFAARGLQQLECPQDGVKLLQDYLADNPTTPYRDLIQAEISKLTPKKKKNPGEAAQPDKAGGDKPADKPEEKPADKPEEKSTDEAKPSE